MTTTSKKMACFCLNWLGVIWYNIYNSEVSAFVLRGKNAYQTWTNAIFDAKVMRLTCILQKGDRKDEQNR